MARLYQVGGSTACPGEENCQTWCSSDPASPVRCPSCPKRNAEGENEGQGETESFEETIFLDGVERLRRDRDSGRPDIYSTVAPDEWKAMKLFDDQFEARRIAHEIRIAEMFEVLMAMITK